MKLTLPFIRVPEIGRGQCFECVLHVEPPNICQHFQDLHGSCTDHRCIYILDTPEAITNYTKVRITE